MITAAIPGARRPWIPVIAAIAFACQPSSGATPRPSASVAGTVTFVTPGGEIPVAVEVADTPDERAKGLMQRRELGANAGMIFVFPHEAQQTFWMKDTYIPLDMIFVSSSRVVAGVVADAEPMTLTGRSVAAPSKYVVEVNAGFAKANGIVAGTQVVFTGVPLETKE